jgi:hypothetical protein
MDVSKVPRRLGKIPYRAFQHRSHTHAVARRVVVEGYCNLHQSLKKPLVFGRRKAPDVFEDLMGIKELRTVEETYSASEFVVSHPSFLKTSDSMEDTGPLFVRDRDGLETRPYQSIQNSKGYKGKNT